MSTDPSDSGREDDPLAELFRQLGIPLPPGGAHLPGGLDLSGLMNQFNDMLTQFAKTHQGTESGVNWDHTRAAARHIAASLGADPTPTTTERQQVADAVRLANLWLDAAISFDSPDATPRAITRDEWIEESMPVWRQIVDPVVTNISRATGSAMSGMLDPGETPPSSVPDFSAFLQPMMRQAIATMYSMQFAQGIGKLAGAVIMGSEFGVPVLASHQPTLVATNVWAFSEGLAQSPDDVRLYLALRETAGQRLFDAVGWLGPQLVALVEHYAREIQIDADSIVTSIDLDNVDSLTPERLQEMSEEMTGKMFSPERTPTQLEILDRLETLLALVEGWIDEVTLRAAEPWMPDVAALAEAWRRRRGLGGPTNEIFHSLVGLDLRPRRVRDAANLWAMLTTQRGASERDHYWEHPDLLPQATHLDDPLSLLQDAPSDTAAEDWDADLQRLLDEENPGGTEA